MDIQLLLQKNDAVTPLTFSVARMVNAGFTGRNQAEVRHHLEELAAKGIEVPDETPVLYPVIPSALCFDTRVDVFGPQTSGEIEYILFVRNEKEIYVGIGSDHTDRKLEETDIPRAKQISPNLAAPLVWDLADVVPHWDDLVMACSVEKNGDVIPYQEGGLGLLMSPDELMALVADRTGGPLADTVIFSGTVKMETDEFVFADRFSGSLTDPVLNRGIGFSYTVHPLDDIR